MAGQDEEFQVSQRSPGLSMVMCEGMYLDIIRVLFDQILKNCILHWAISS